MTDKSAPGSRITPEVGPKPEVGELSPDVVAIVTDIDNTLGISSPEDETLAGYTGRALADWLRTREERGAVDTLREAVQAETGQADIETVIDSAYAWIRDKRQSTALESVLGAFWRDAYAGGGLDNTLSPDAVAQLEFWAEDRRALFVYAERPRVAQQTLIADSDHGDLADLFAGFFDTRMGPPDEAATYSTVGAALGEIPASILFISANGEALDAAAAAGWQTCFIARDTETEERAYQQQKHPVVADFSEIELL